jgi:hypothetical protein
VTVKSQSREDRLNVLSHVRPIDPRLPAIRAAEAAWLRRSLFGEPILLPSFAALLETEERRRLTRAYPELAGAPSRSDAWEERARAFLGRFLDFAQLTSMCGLVVEVTRSRGCVIALTANASLVAAEPSRVGEHVLTYAPLAGPLRHARVVGGRRLSVGRGAQLGPLRLSPIVALATGDGAAVGAALERLCAWVTAR